MHIQGKPRAAVSGRQRRYGDFQMQLAAGGIDGRAIIYTASPFDLHPWPH